MTGGEDPERLAPMPEPEPAPGSGTASVKDIDRRVKPSEFFSTLGSAAATGPANPLMLSLNDRFIKRVEDDIADARREFAAAQRAERLFPVSADTMARGALEGFKPGDSVGVSCIPRETPLLVIGDTHGDSWSLAAALRLAREPEHLHRLGVLPQVTRPAVVMLGDLVDRGQDHVECAMLALRRIRARPHSTIWIAGNHDIGHRWSEDDARFVSELAPAEFADWLNAGELGERSRRIDFGKTFLEYVAGLPRAVAFQCGLLAIHGGVPHCDIFHTFDSFESLKQSSAAKDDFTWIRVAERAPVKYPNRSRRGCELGTEQFVASVAHISGLLEREGHPRITAVVRGHDHHDDRHFVHRAGFPSMSLITVNTMGAGDECSSPFLAGDLQPCVAVYVQGRAPCIVKLVRPVVKSATDGGPATNAVPTNTSAPVGMSAIREAADSDQPTGNRPDAPAADPEPMAAPRKADEGTAGDGGSGPSVTEWDPKTRWHEIR
jgi:hypothetical protein